MKYSTSTGSRPENAIKNSTVELPLATDDIMDLLNLCLTSTYFQYGGKNNYNTDFVRRNTHSNADSNIQTNSGPVTTATIPYIRGTYETVARILQPYNIPVARKPITTLRRLLTNVKDKTNRRTEREQYTRSNTATVRLLTLVKPAET